MTIKSVLELLRCDIINACFDDSIDKAEELRRQREFITEATAKLKDLMLEWQKPYEDYITLLKEELDEVVPIASIHGWESKRITQGRILRSKIADSKQKVGLL